MVRVHLDPPICSLKIAYELYNITSKILRSKPRNILCDIKCKTLKNFDVNRSSYKGRMVNALASGADEGRDNLR